MMMRPSQTIRNPWWWLGVLGLLLVVIGLTGRAGAIIGAIFVPDALIVDQSESEAK